MSAKPKPSRKADVARGFILIVAVTLVTSGTGTARGNGIDDYLGPCALVASGDGRTLYVANADAMRIAWVDVATEAVTGSVELPRRPNGLALGAGGKRLYVSCGGPGGTVAVIDVASRKTIREIPAGHTPSGLAATPDGKTLFVCNRFDDDVSVIDVAAGRPGARIATGREPIDVAIRPDGLNWDLFNDGVGNPKNTKTMLLAHATPPSMSTGMRPTAEGAVRSGIQNTLFATLHEEDAVAIDRYLGSLRPVPSPRLVEGRLSESARRGKDLFEDRHVGCSRCHPAPLYTDMRKRDVKSKGPYDHRDKFDTPTLVEVWRTAPYLHDGSFATVKDLLSEGRHGNADGQLDELDDRQMDDLVEFVLSL